MTPRAEKWSVAVGCLGIAGFAFALWLALPPYVAIGFVSLVLVFGGIGCQALGRAFLYSVPGVEDKLKEQESPPVG